MSHKAPARLMLEHFHLGTYTHRGFINKTEGIPNPFARSHKSCNRVVTPNPSAAATKAESRVVTFHASSLQGGPLVVYRLRGCHIRTKQSTLHDSWEPGGPPGTCHVTTFPHPATASSWVCDGQNANKTM